MPRSSKKGRIPSGDRGSSTPSSSVRRRQGPRRRLNVPRQPVQKKAVPDPLAAGSSSNSPRQPRQKLQSPSADKSIIAVDGTTVVDVAADVRRSPRQKLKSPSADKSIIAAVGTAVDVPIDVKVSVDVPMDIKVDMGSLGSDTMGSDTKADGKHDGSMDNVVITVDESLFSPQPILLSYPFPFVAGSSVDEACQDLPLCNVGVTVSNTVRLKRQKEKSSGRHHYSTIVQDDRDTLKPHRFLNDVIIDFWMQWLSRNSCDRRGDVMYFTSHFYAKLADGPSGVLHAEQWLRNRQVDIFSYRIIFFPVNMHKHWSLCVAISPGTARTYALLQLHEDRLCCEFPCMLHLDSMDYHSSVEIGNSIRQFFNECWKKKHKNDNFMFNSNSYPIVCPIGKNV